MLIIFALVCMLSCMSKAITPPGDAMWFAAAMLPHEYYANDAARCCDNHYVTTAFVHEHQMALVACVYWLTQDDVRRQILPTAWLCVCCAGTAEHQHCQSWHCLQVCLFSWRSFHFMSDNIIMACRRSVPTANVVVFVDADSVALLTHVTSWRHTAKYFCASEIPTFVIVTREPLANVVHHVQWRFLIGACCF